MPARSGIHWIENALRSIVKFHSGLVMSMTRPGVCGPIIWQHYGFQCNIEQQRYAVCGYNPEWEHHIIERWASLKRSEMPIFNMISIILTWLLKKKNIIRNKKYIYIKLADRIFNVGDKIQMKKNKTHKRLFHLPAMTHKPLVRLWILFIIFTRARGSLFVSENETKNK